MSFINKLWNAAAERFSGTAKYFTDNNINTVSVTNVAGELGAIGAGIGGKAAETAQQATHAAVDAIVSSPAAILQLAVKAGTFAADTGYKALQGAHSWYLGEAAETAQQSSGVMLKDLAVNLTRDGLKYTHDQYFGKTSADAQQSSAAMLKDLALNVPYDAIKNTHEWYFGKTADAAPQGGVTMAIDLAGAAGSKVLDIGYSAVTSAYNWYFNTPANDAADQPQPEAGAAPMMLTADGMAAATDLPLGQDNADTPFQAPAAANTGNDAAAQPPVASIQAKELVPTSSLIQSPDGIVSTDGFVNNQDDDAAIAYAGHDLSSWSDEPVTDHPFTEYFGDVSMMSNHLAMSQPMTTVSVY